MKQKQLAKRPRGRPSLYTPAVADEIVDWIASGKTLADYCRLPGSPERSTITRWCQTREDFFQRFARAREIGFDVIAEEALEIADTQEVGQRVEEGPDGKKTVTEDMLGHRRLRIDTRLKLLAKWDPRRYGDKLDVQHQGAVPMVVKIDVPDSAEERESKLKGNGSRA